jgi:hypothetical protein
LKQKNGLVRQIGLQERLRLIRGAQFFERVEFVFHRTFKVRWIAKVATGR